MALVSHKIHLLSKLFYLAQSYKLHFWNTFPSSKHSQSKIIIKVENIFQKYEKYSPRKNVYESELYYFSYLVNPFGIILFPIALFRNVFDSLEELPAYS